MNRASKREREGIFGKYQSILHNVQYTQETSRAFLLALSECKTNYSKLYSSWAGSDTATRTHEQHK